MLFWLLLVPSISAKKHCQLVVFSCQKVFRFNGLMECPIPEVPSKNKSICGTKTVACPTKNHSCYAVVMEDKLKEGGCLRNEDNHRAVMHPNRTFSYEKTYFVWSNPCRFGNKTGEYEVDYLERIFGKIFKVCCNRHCTRKDPLQWGTYGKKIDAISVGIMLAICFFGITLEKVIGRYKKYQAKCLVLRNMKKFK